MTWLGIENTLVALQMLVSLCFSLQPLKLNYNQLKQVTLQTFNFGEITF